ncbi:MAG: hypothetical protein Q9213_005809 [Squamulea squamosa]
MSKEALTTSLLIVSDTAFRDPSTDKVGQVLTDVFNQDSSNQWKISEIQIVPDDVVEIQRRVTGWCDGATTPNLIVTTGGTGFTQKDNTPEAIHPLLHKHATGLMQVAGEDSRIAHIGGVKALEEQAAIGPVKATRGHNESHHSHRHSCGHAAPNPRTAVHERPISNDPTAGPASRHRESQWPMESVDDAMKLILDYTPDPKVVKVPVDVNLVGCVLAEDVQADEPVPAFRASIMDGYAVVVSKASPSSKGVYPIASVSHANPGDVPPLPNGQVARITTGARLPSNATSVVKVEETKIRKTTKDGQEEEEVEILTDATPGENVRDIGSDVKAGETILKKGDVVTAVGGELGLLASVGKQDVSIYKRPVVGVLSTGDEIVPHNRPGSLRLGEVRDTNRPTIMAAVQGWGFQVVDLGIATDKVDVIVTTGGVSMGDLDLLQPTIERSLGGTIHFGRVTMKPGKPTTFATVPFKNNAGNRESRLVFSLPGNPASAIVTSHLFVLPSLQQSSGLSVVGLPKIVVTLDHDFRLDPARPEYHRVIVSANKDGLLHASSTGGQRSSRVGSLKNANALLCLPAKEGTITMGERLQALLMGDLLGL